MGYHIDVEGLSDNQVKVIKELVELFKMQGQEENAEDRKRKGLPRK